MVSKCSLNYYSVKAFMAPGDARRLFKKINQKMCSYICNTTIMPNFDQGCPHLCTGSLTTDERRDEDKSLNILFTFYQSKWYTVILHYMQYTAMADAEWKSLWLPRTKTNSSSDSKSQENNFKSGSWNIWLLTPASRNLNISTHYFWQKRSSLWQLYSSPWELHLSNNHSIIIWKLIIWNLQVEGGGPFPDASRGIIVGTVTGAVISAIITSVGNGHTT